MLTFVGFLLLKIRLLKYNYPSLGCRERCLHFILVSTAKKIPCRFKRLTLVKRNTIRKEAQGVYSECICVCVSVWGAGRDAGSKVVAQA